VGRLVSCVLRPRSGPSPLAQAVTELKAGVQAAGLTDAKIDAGLAAYNAEYWERAARRDRIRHLDPGRGRAEGGQRTHR